MNGRLTKVGVRVAPTFETNLVVEVLDYFFTSGYSSLDKILKI